MNAVRGQFALVTAILAGTLAVSHFTNRRIDESLAEPLNTIPRAIAGWTKVADQELDPRALSKLLPTSYLSSTYQRGDRQLGVFVAFYAQQRAGESMHSPKNCLPGSGWEIMKQDSAVVPVEGHSFKINKYYIQNGTNRMIVYYWYQSRGRIIASEYLGKILLVRDSLLDGRTAASIVRVTVPDEPSSEQEGAEFAAHLMTEMRRCFGS